MSGHLPGGDLEFETERLQDFKHCRKARIAVGRQGHRLSRPRPVALASFARPCERATAEVYRAKTSTSPSTPVMTLKSRW